MSEQERQPWICPKCGLGCAAHVDKCDHIIRYDPALAVDDELTSDEIRKRLTAGSFNPGIR